LVDSSEMIKSIGCKWVFKRKIDIDDNVQTYKTRLVSKSYQKKKQGVDFNEAFSSVVLLNFIRILLATVAYHDCQNCIPKWKSL
jgi:hypothetical protein